MNVKTFPTCLKNTTIQVDNKLIKLREDRQLLARFLVIQQSRPTMIESPNWKIRIFCYPALLFRWASTDSTKQECIREGHCSIQNEIQTDLYAQRNDDKCVDDVTEKNEMCVLSML